MAHHRWWVLSSWIVIVVAAAVSYPHLLSSLGASDYSVTGSDSAKVAHLIQKDFSAAGAEQDVIVFDSATSTIHDPAYQAAVDKVLASVHGQPGVVSVIGPTDPGAQNQISADGHSALASLGLSGDDRQRGDRARDLQDVVAAAAGNGPVNAYLTGYSPSANDVTDVENADVERAESIGIPIAFVVLLLALGAVVSAFIPLLMALVSLLATFGVLSALSTVKTLDAFLLSIVTMIGVGISIDYALFVLSRYREELARGRDEGVPDPVPSAVGTAMRTSGKTILFSGTIVVIALFSLFVVKAPIFQGIAVGAVLVVVCTLLVAWTMLPALLAALGDRVNRWGLPRRMRPPEGGGPKTSRDSGWARWARTVLAHPWLAIPGAALLILFALPTFGIKLGIDLGLSAISDTPSGKAETVLVRSFSPGVLSPIQILATHQGSGPLSAADLKTIEDFTTQLSKDPRVADVYSISEILAQTEGEVSPQALERLQQDPAAAPLLAQTVNTATGSNQTIITVVSKAAVDTTEATDLVHDLRKDLIPSATASAGPSMLVGGETAQFVDLSNETLGKLPVVMTLVLALSFCYLMVIFRSLLVPAKAVVMNLLATAAAFGLVTWVFQDDHLSGLFGFTSVGFIQTYLPIMVFVLLFGLSMDYEVFLMGRIQEEWLLTHDNDDAVVTGVAHTGRAITAAAAIMASVFGCFLVADVLELKEFGFALAVAVILDATIVRLLLVPAIMKVAGGRANWWLPKFLRRILPEIRLE
ncbi:MMPL family transporter [Catenulispora subtropica]|uniref:MMPL family transporter n=1 Tax=Catenulispora subtropica TaxID=450798 RepID=A0ABN2SMK2_9ACTN